MDARCTRCGDELDQEDELCSYCEEDSCTHCGASLDDGQGFDGFCGNCADILEGNRYWDGNQEAALEALADRIDGKV